MQNAAQHSRQHIAGKIGCTAGIDQIAQRIGADARQHGHKGTEKHANTGVAEKAGTDADGGRQLNTDTQQIHGDVERDEERCQRQTARMAQFCRGTAEQIRMFHQKILLLWAGAT